MSPSPNNFIFKARKGKEIVEYTLANLEDGGYCVPFERAAPDQLPKPRPKK